MPKRSTLPPPRVFWPDPEDEDTRPDAAAVRDRVQTLVNAVWRRLPRPVREIIVLDAPEVMLFRGSNTISCEFEPIPLIDFTVTEVLFTPHGELAAMWLLAEAFGQSFWWSVVVRLAGADPQVDPLPGTPRTPVEAWYQSFFHDVDGPYCRMTRQLTAVLALSSGFGEEWAAAMSVDSIREEYAEMAPWLEPELPAIYWLFRPRPVPHGTHDDRRGSC